MVEGMESATIGLIADTHGILEESAHQQLEGCDVIIHAGDLVRHGSHEVC